MSYFAVPVSYHVTLSKVKDFVTENSFKQSRLRATDVIRIGGLSNKVMMYIYILYIYFFSLISWVSRTDTLLTCQYVFAIYHLHGDVRFYICDFRVLIFDYIH